MRGLGLLCPTGAEPKSYGKAGARCVDANGKLVRSISGPELPPGFGTRAPARPAASGKAKSKKASKRSASKTIKITKSVRVTCGCAAPKAKIRTGKKKSSKKS